MVDRNDEQQIEIDQIQGDVLVGLRKKAEMFTGFVIGDVACFKRFLADLRPTTMRQALQDRASIEEWRAGGGGQDLDIRGINIAFTRSGLDKLVGDAAGIDDAAFQAGLAARSGMLNDPVEGEGAVGNWVLGNGVGPLDGLLLVTGRGPDEVAATMDEIDRAAGGDAAWTTFYSQIGTVRPGLAAGHEHFGYQDCISQPAVRGRIDGGGGATPIFLDPGLSPGHPEQGLPGTDLHWPGEFVFGYATQNAADADRSVEAGRGGPSWMRNGSLMVFRRLEQKVPEFHQATAAAAEARGMSADLLEARLIGRFRSGAPVSLVPNGVDDPALGGNELRNNDFEFGAEDMDGVLCPYAAHIRKAYPRNDLTPAAMGRTDEAAHDASEADTQKHRILRRGIPFGPEVTDAEQRSGKTACPRGLMFVCYQTSITGQFEFITQNWVNQPDFAVAGTGVDPVIGRAGGADADRSITVGPPAPDGSPGRIELHRDFVIPTGGGYFFVPSIDALRNVLSAGS